MVTTYFRRPIKVLAVQWNGEDLSSIDAFTEFIRPLNPVCVHEHAEYIDAYFGNGGHDRSIVRWRGWSGDVVLHGPRDEVVNGVMVGGRAMISEDWIIVSPGDNGVTISDNESFDEIIETVD